MSTYVRFKENDDLSFFAIEQAGFKPSLFDYQFFSFSDTLIL